MLPICKPPRLAREQPDDGQMDDEQQEQGKEEFLHYAPTSLVLVHPLSSWQSNHLPQSLRRFKPS